MGAKSKILIGLMALCVAGSVGGVFALTRNAATKTGPSGAYDKAIYLFWDSGESSVELADMNNLSAGVAQYRYLTVAPKSTQGVEGKIRLTFTLAASGQETHMEGLSINVYKTASLATDQTVAGLINEVSPEPTLNKSVLTGTTEFNLNADQNHETTAYYAIKVLWNGDQDMEHQSYEMGAVLTISQSYIEQEGAIEHEKE